MTTVEGTLTLRTVHEGLHFDAQFPAGTIAMDSGPHCIAPNPVVHLLASLAACLAMDVIGILRKKRQKVSAYEVAMSGVRADEHPRRYTSITLAHRLTGTDLSRAAVEEAVQLATEKYCSVYHTLRPDLPITNTIELFEG